jgi:hypothetical protein
MGNAASSKEKIDATKPTEVSYVLKLKKEIEQKFKNQETEIFIFPNRNFVMDPFDIVMKSKKNILKISNQYRKTILYSENLVPVDSSFFDPVLNVMIQRKQKRPEEYFKLNLREILIIDKKSNIFCFVFNNHKINTRMMLLWIFEKSSIFQTLTTDVIQIIYSYIPKASYTYIMVCNSNIFREIRNNEEFKFISDQEFKDSFGEPSKILNENY